MLYSGDNIELRGLAHARCYIVPSGTLSRKIAGPPRTVRATRLSQAHTLLGWRLLLPGHSQGMSSPIR
jgi:hypothetical protein